MLRPGKKLEVILVLLGANGIFWPGFPPDRSDGPSNQQKGKNFTCLSVINVVIVIYEGPYPIVADWFHAVITLNDPFSVKEFFSAKTITYVS